MKSILIGLALACTAGSCDVAAQVTHEPGATPTSTQRRYCDKLSESAAAYVQFVRRLAPIYTYTVWDFAPRYDGAPVKVNCRAGKERIAAVRALAASELVALR